jgi:hypothetical protein
MNPQEIDMGVSPQISALLPHLPTIAVLVLISRNTG